MFSYYYVNFTIDGVNNSFVTCDPNGNLLNVEGKDIVIKSIKRYSDPKFFVVEPVKVEKTAFGYNVRHQFFKSGVIGIELNDSTYYVEFEKHDKPIERVVDDVEVFEIGLARFFNSSDETIEKIVLEDIDEGHLIDRLSCAVIEIHEKSIVNI